MFGRVNQWNLWAFLCWKTFVVVTDSTFLLISGLLKFSICSCFHLGKLCVSKNLSISSGLSSLLVYRPLVSFCNTLLSKSWPLFFKFLSCWLSSLSLSTMASLMTPSLAPTTALCQHFWELSHYVSVPLILSSFYLPLKSLVLYLLSCFSSSGEDYCLTGCVVGWKGERTLIFMWILLPLLKRKEEEEKGRKEVQPFKWYRLCDLEQVAWCLWTSSILWG